MCPLSSPPTELCPVQLCYLLLNQNPLYLNGSGNYVVNFSAQALILHPRRHTKCLLINLLTPIDDYSGRTAPLTSKCCILYIYSTNIGTEYFKHCIYSPFLPLQNAVCFIILTYLVPVFFSHFIYRVC